MDLVDVCRYVDLQQTRCVGIAGTAGKSGIAYADHDRRTNVESELKTVIEPPGHVV